MITESVMTESVMTVFVMWFGDPHRSPAVRIRRGRRPCDDAGQSKHRSNTGQTRALDFRACGDRPPLGEGACNPLRIRAAFRVHPVKVFTDMVITDVVITDVVITDVVITDVVITDVSDVACQ